MQQFENATTGHGVLTRAGKLVAADRVLRSWLGGREFSEMLPELSDVASKEVLQTVLARVDKAPISASISVSEIDGELGELLLVQIDIFPPESAHYRDPVTGLPDRRALEWQRQSWRHESKTEAVPHALLFMDLVGFKHINDQHGHALGDKVLQALAERWQHSLRHGDLIVRYGGDEFVVLLRGIGTAKAAQPIIERLQKITEQPLQLQDKLLRVEVTIGLSLADDLSVSIEALLAEADKTMYAAKRSG
jgi:diguanylate cyclase (GGDEF)-like protein